MSLKTKLPVILGALILAGVGYYYQQCSCPKPEKATLEKTPEASVSPQPVSEVVIPPTAVTAIARFGEPAYKPGFTHFNHANPNAPKGGTLRLSTIGTFDTVNKDIVKGICAQGILECYDPLMARSASEPFTFYAVLAQAVVLAADASSITFYLNPKARFHDGSAVTAADVKATIETLRDKGLPRYRQHYTRIEKMEILHPHVIKISLKPLETGGYDPELPFIIAGLRVLKKDQIESINFADSGLTKIIGSGPYKVGAVNQGRSISLERDPNYWGKDLPVKKGFYNFDTIKIEYFKNAQVQFQAFSAGEFDVHFEGNPNQWESGYNFAALKDGHVKRAELRHQRPVTVRTIIFNMRRPIFAEWKLRKALTLALDFNTLNKMVFCNSMLCPSSMFANTYLAHKGPATGKEAKILKNYADKIKPELLKMMLDQPFTPAQTNGDGDQRENLARAAVLLKEAGYTLQNGKCVDVKGQPLTFEIMIKDPRLEKIALSFKESLKKLGIDLSVRMMDTVQYENRVIESDFDMIIHAFTNTLSPGNEQVYYFSAKNADIKGSSNYIGVKDPVAEALATGVATARDIEALEAAVHAFDRYVMHMCYQIPLSYENNLRWAYWVDKLATPEIDPKIGLDVMNVGWSPKAGQ
ncbi:extracellular solute-binding protein [Candidatus Finniella inopinata]|uniref:ABC transporter substrate-binding protein n=1 Tax=Candidatus Finniella inopinata TaxID=1696036 RepID=A0A4Q7DIC8_9PROT|nr:extracellular solute-binding protein [Candidatus Finniella inopinata]RZI46078.1 ABC transporter substrate-binding protein [Candidatus Finniella inopinata]